MNATKRMLLCLLLTMPLMAETPIEEAERIASNEPARGLQIVERLVADARKSGDEKQLLEALQAACSIAMEARPENLVAIADDGLAAARRINDPSAISSFHLCRGYGLEVRGESEASLSEYEKAVEFARRSRDRNDLGQALILRGEMHYYRGTFGDSLTDLKEAYQIFTASNEPKKQIRALSGIANLYADVRVGQYDRAIEYYQQILAFEQKANSLSGLSTAHYNLASTFERKNRLDDALTHFRKSLAYEEQRGDKDEAAYVRRSIGIILTKLGRTREALTELNRALARFEGTNADRAAMTHLSRGITYSRMKQYPQALRDLEIARVHFEKEQNARFLEKVEDERAIAFEKVGDWRGAAQARKAQLDLDRRLAKDLREEQTARMRVQFDAEKKEAENRALLRERENEQRIRSLQGMVILLGAAILLIIATLAARTIIKARRLRVMAMTDELTRLPNRRALLLFADEQLRRKQTFCLVAFDIDHFKRVNDSYGHDIGDEVLRRVADVCRAALRRDDRLGRTGGEEFIAVLPRTTAGVALEVAERLRDAVASSAGDPHVTISLGVSEWTHSDSFASLAKRADESLYRAKEGGRNRVELAVA